MIALTRIAPAGRWPRRCWWLARHRRRAGDGRDLPVAFVKRLDRPEKYLYVFCVDADAKDNDFVAVIDVDPDSATYGTIIAHARPRHQGERDAPLGLHRRPDEDLGGRPVLEPDLDPRRGDRPGQAADREGARRRPRGDRPVGPAHATTPCRAGC